MTIGDGGKHTHTHTYSYAPALSYRLPLWQQVDEFVWPTVSIPFAAVVVGRPFVCSSALVAV